MEKVIVFGCGRYYQSKKAELESRYDVAGFLDNAIKPGEVRKFEGKDVVSPENLSFFDENMSIILMSAAFFEMRMQLKRLDVDAQRIKLAVLMQPYYDEIEKLLSEAAESIEAAEDGIVIRDRAGVNVFAGQDDWKAYLRTLFARKYDYIGLIAKMPNRPVSKRFALERGTAIDRIYIESFLKANRDKIQGTVMEIADSRYTKMFGSNVEQRLMLHLNGWGKGVIKGSLETGEGLIPDSVDCLICTQTIQFIYDMHEVVRNIHKLLKPGGTALVTAHCLGQISLYDYHNWGEYWRFTGQSMYRLFAENFDKGNIVVQSFGNVKTAIAYQYGLCAEDLKEEDFAYQDEQFPVIVTVSVIK
jgi:hypothetical protein